MIRKSESSIMGMLKIGIYIIGCVFFVQAAITLYAGENASSPVPSYSRQLIVVVTDSFPATKGTLYRFDRGGDSQSWNQTGDKVAAVLGESGLGWGDGLYKPAAGSTPVKMEGDGRSPAGVFPLGEVFGYLPADQMTGLKMPYIALDKMTECVDDSNSEHYNSIISRAGVEQVDWNSSERMRFAGISYEQGVVVNYNTGPVHKGAGSCIFLHNWTGPDEKTSGCTAMSPADMKTVIRWLDDSLNPVLVQLPRAVYLQYQAAWGLPEVEGKD